MREEIALDQAMEYYDAVVRSDINRADNVQKNPDWGIIYTGEGDSEYLNQWCERVAINFAGRSLGVYSFDQIEEAVSCM